MNGYSGVKRKLITGAVLALALVTSVRALSREEVRGRMVTFIEFYVAAEQANAPRMSFWERVVYGVGVARSREPITTVTRCADSFLAD